MDDESVILRGNIVDLWIIDRPGRGLTKKKRREVTAGTVAFGAARTRVLHRIGPLEGKSTGSVTLIVESFMQAAIVVSVFDRVVTPDLRQCRLERQHIERPLTSVIVIGSL